MFGLRNRLLVLFTLLLVLSIVIAGIISYASARKTLVQTVEQRLQREAEVMSYTVRNLQFVYISDEAYFRQQVEMSISEQKRQLENDGYVAHFYYYAQDSFTPFLASKDANLPLDESFLTKIAASDNGVFHYSVGARDYTVSVHDLPEIDGRYILLVPTDSYLGPVQVMARDMLLAIGASLVVSIILIVWFVRGLMRPLTELQKRWRT